MLRDYSNVQFSNVKLGNPSPAYLGNPSLLPGQLALKQSNYFFGYIIKYTCYIFNRSN